jgi:hypothetical protein
MVGLCFLSPICLHGIVLNEISTGKTLPYSCNPIQFLNFCSFWRTVSRLVLNDSSLILSRFNESFFFSFSTPARPEHLGVHTASY